MESTPPLQSPIWTETEVWSADPPRQKQVGMSFGVREETGVVAETMGIYPTSHTPNTDIGADKPPNTTDVGWCEGLLETGIIGRQVERTDSREEMGVMPEAMVIRPTPHPPKTNSSTGRIGTEVSRCEHRFLGTGKRDGTLWGYRVD